MDAELHCQRLLLADDLRHLLKKRPQAFVRLGQLCVFFPELCLLPDQLRDIRSGDLSITDPGLRCDLLLRKAHGRSVRKAVDAKLRTEAVHVRRRRPERVLHFRKRLNAAFSQKI